MNERYQVCLRFVEEARDAGMDFLHEIRPIYVKSFNMEIPDAKNYFRKVLDERRTACRTLAR